MKINLPKDFTPRLQKLIAAKDQNILASDFLLRYLLDSSSYSLEREFKRRASISAAKEHLLATVLVEAITKKRQHADVILDHLAGRCDFLSSEHYRDNLFLKTIKIHEEQVGKWRLSFDHYAPYQAFAYKDINVDQCDFREMTRLGFFDKLFSYPVVLEGKRVWMSITPHEIETMQPAIDEAAGVVAVMGLGLGYFPFMIAKKDSVKKIYVYEKDEEVISLFTKYLWPQFPHREKITIIAADVLSDFHSCLEKSRPDYAFIDIWQGVDDGLPLYVHMKAKEKDFPKVRFRYWIEKSLIAMLRRIVITILEEALDGYTANDYQNIEKPIDEIFNTLFRKLVATHLVAFDDVLELLTDDGIRKLLKR